MPRKKSYYLGFADLKELNTDIYYDYYMILNTALNEYNHVLPNETLDIINRYMSAEYFKLVHANRLYLTSDFYKVELMAVNIPNTVLENIYERRFCYQLDLAYDNSIYCHYPHVWIFYDNTFQWSPISPRMYGELLDTFRKENIIDRNQNRFEWYTSQVKRNSSK
jgi:hypothetical protein